MELEHGVKVRAVTDLKDPTGDDPNCFVAKGTIGTVTDETDADTPTVDFGKMTCTVRHEEIAILKMAESYENGVCGNCGEPISDDAVDGDECANCGHVFYHCDNGFVLQ